MSDREWWQDGVVYQIYPRSFADSNGDGVGDLRGIIERLDYLNDGTEQSLGVDAIWLSPINPSPMFDFGYDVSDYRSIAAEFGTVEDFEELVTEAHRRGIRILLDLVMNHCSSEHPWFREALTSREAEKRDWFIWHDGNEGGTEPPNNWLAAFGGRAWEWHEPTRQYYLHSFLKEQPDFDWRNPALKQAMWSIVRHWLDRGVDGFRLDVVNWFLKDDELRDNPVGPLSLDRLRPYDRQHHVYDRNRPETIGVMKELRRVVDEHPHRMAVGEVFVPAPGDPELPAQYYADGEGLHLSFNFAFLYCNWDAGSFARVIDRWEELLGPDLWPNYTLSNHDQPRARSRYGTEERARVAAAMLLTLRGTPFLYYGEEIGMTNGRIPRWRMQDPLGKRYWPLHPGRDPARTPMQWSAEQHAGFTRGRPWLPVNGDYDAVNVERQDGDPKSLLAWHRRLIHLRKREPALHRGGCRRVPQTVADVLVYERSSERDRIVVALDFVSEPRRVKLPEGEYRVLAGTHRAADAIEIGSLELAADEALILKRS